MQKKNETGTIVFYDVGLVSESEVVKLTGYTAQQLKLTPCGPEDPKDPKSSELIRNEEGGRQKLFLISLAGLDCGTLASLRKFRTYSTISLSLDNHIQPFTKQLHASQGNLVFEGCQTSMLANMPAGVKATGHHHLPTVENLVAKMEEMQRIRQAKEQQHLDSIYHTGTVSTALFY